MDDCGIVTHVFSDKTGTLTENEMKFKTACVGTKVYGPCGNPLKFKRQATVPSAEAARRKAQKNRTEDDKAKDEFMDGLLYEGQSINLKIRGGDQPYEIQTQQRLMFEYLKILGLAHEAVKDDVTDLEDLGYQGPSPDEIAMVETAAERGLIFIRNLN